MGWKEVNAKLGAMQSDFAYAGSQRPPKAADIDAVEQRLGVRFPPEYRDIVGRFAAFTVEAKEEHWPAPELYDIGPSWTFTRGFALLAFGDGVPEFLDIERATADLRERTTADIVPFFRVSASGDRICFKPDGQIVEWRHDEQGLHPSEHDTVYDLMLFHLEQLEENMAEMKRMRAKASAAPVAKRKASPKRKAVAKPAAKAKLAAKAKPAAKAAPAAKAKPAAKKKPKAVAKKKTAAKAKKKRRS